MLSRKWMVIILSLAISVFLLLGCAAPAPAPAPSPAPAPAPAPAPKPTPTEVPKPASAELPKNIAIGTLAKGSSNNIIGAALSKVISAHTPISAVDRPPRRDD